MNKELRNKLLGVVGVLTMGITLGYIFFWCVDHRLEQNERVYTTKIRRMMVD